MSKTFYLTTTLPYVNAPPHVGFAMEIIEADIIARFMKLEGREVFFNTGTDEHGQKVFHAALSAKKDPQLYTDELSESFRGLQKLLNLDSELHFIRTTDPHHKKAAQEFWRLCDGNGYIYKKNYKIKYCVGCELEKTESEIENGRCIIHPNLELEIIEEENYFFKFSAFQDRLSKFYEEHKDFVIPDFRFNEIKAFVSRGLEDFSISRLTSKMSWGVPVPGDDKHVMYVWFDALVSYISTLGWPGSKLFDIFWANGNNVQFAGKDQIRQQAAMWQAMLMAAGLPQTEKIILHGFLNFGGQKMSKSLGNVISPQDIVAQFGSEALRYFVAREFNQFEDTDISVERLKDSYNADLANGLGNLVSRIMKMAKTNLATAPVLPEKSIPDDFTSALYAFEIQKAAEIVWKHIAALDLRIQETEPFKLIKQDREKAVAIISQLSVELYTIAKMLHPIMPETSAAIKAMVKTNKAPEKPLFARMD